MRPRRVSPSIVTSRQRVSPSTPGSARPTRSAARGWVAARQLARLLPLKTRAEYGPDDVPKATATKAVRAATQIVAIAQRVAAAT